MMRDTHPHMKKVVLITGCSSGIGKQSAITLAKHGFTVFATVRKEADAEALRHLGLPGLLPIWPLDLTNLAHITQAADIVVNELDRLEIKGLYGLVNDAGGGSQAPIELMDLDELRRELHTRILGSVAMVRAFLPLIRKANGRILWITTPAIIPTPYVATIHACDFAINCLARTLDIELKPWGIPNIMIRCGGIKTPAGLRTVSDIEALIRKSPSERVVLYERALRKWAQEMSEFDKKRTEPEEVAKVLLNALITKHPKRRYSVGHMAKAARFLEFLPQSITDWILKMRF